MIDYFVHPSSFIDDGCQIGAGTKIWHFSHIQSGARIGRNCVLGQNVNVGPNVIIGNRCKIQNNVSLYTGVVLEDCVFCGPSCVFTNVINPRAFVERKSEFRPTLVREGASIGANATILCGITLGRFCLIGAGAVLTRNVPDHALLAGIPADGKGWVCECGTTLGDTLTCSDCGKQYRYGESGLCLV